MIDGGKRPSDRSLLFIQNVGKDKGVSTGPCCSVGRILCYLVFLDLFKRSGQPDDGGLVAAGRQDAIAVGREREGGHRRRMPIETQHRIAAVRVPDSGHAVAAAADHPLAVWREGDGREARRVASLHRVVDGCGGAFASRNSPTRPRCCPSLQPQSQNPTLFLTSTRQPSHLPRQPGLSSNKANGRGSSPNRHHRDRTRHFGD